MARWSGRSYSIGAAILGLAASCVWPLAFHLISRPFTDYSWDLVEWPRDVTRWGRLGLLASFLGPPIWAWLGFSLGRWRHFAGGVMAWAALSAFAFLADYRWETGTALARGEPGVSLAAYLLSWVHTPRVARAMQTMLAFASGRLLSRALLGASETMRAARLLPAVLSAACLGYAVLWTVDRDGARFTLDVLHHVVVPHSVWLTSPAAVLWVAFPIAAALWGYVGFRPASRRLVFLGTAAYAALVVALTVAGWNHAIFSAQYTRQFLGVLTMQELPAAVACGLLAGPLVWHSGGALSPTAGSARHT